MVAKRSSSRDAREMHQNSRESLAIETIITVDNTAQLDQKIGQ
jgi:hypothetical protein